MTDKEKLEKIEGYVHVRTVYYMNLLLDENQPQFQKDYLQGKLDMLNNINDDLFDGMAQMK